VVAKWSLINSSVATLAYNYAALVFNVPKAVRRTRAGGRLLIDEAGKAIVFAQRCIRNSSWVWERVYISL
jgi:hypothetical protein